jgi:malonyl-CoA O-methyltransferase
MSGTSAGFELDRRGLAYAFDRASAQYDGAAQLQTTVRGELLARLDYVRLAPAVVLDLGSGTGHASRELKRRYPRALVVALDLAPGMLHVARRHSRLFRRFARVCGDAYRLPFASASVDLIFSNLMLQWCDELAPVCAELRRVLKPGGLLAFSTLGPDTLHELRAAWASADGFSHVNRFLDMHDVGDALARAGLAEPVLDVDRHVFGFADTLALMRSLKALGAHNVTAGRPRGLTGRRRLAAMQAAYESLRSGGALPVTYEVIYGAAWGTAAPRATAPHGAEVHVPLSAIARPSRRS